MTPERQEFFKSKACHWGYHIDRYEIGRMKAEVRKHKFYLNEHKKHHLSGGFDVAWSLRYINKLNKRIRNLRKELRLAP